jgi:hypothetical protein
MIDRRLLGLGSNLTPTEIVRRSQTQSCAGCHQLSNQSPANLLGDGLVWPGSLGFVHVSERDTDIINAGLHFKISPALENVFIPHREDVFEDYLAGLPCRRCMSLPLTDSDSNAFIPVRTTEAAPQPPSPDEIIALDQDRKRHLPNETLGGPRPVH